MTAPNPPRLISLRVWGDFACVTRPELKAERVSYTVLTPSAARGILEAVYFEPQMSYLIHEIGVVKRGRWFSFRRNEVSKVVSFRDAARAMDGAGRLATIQAGGGAPDATQRGMLALAGVEYLITAEIRLSRRAEPPRDNLDKYHDLFVHRATRGKCFHRPYLGCREFDAHFAYVPDPSTVQLGVEEWAKQEDLGLMLYDVFDPRDRDSGDSARPSPVFFEAKLWDARLECHPDRVRLVRRRLPGQEVIL
jgi:CRISPR-associated protein Cas5d